MKIKLSSTLACTAVLAFASGAEHRGDTVRRCRRRMPPPRSQRPIRNADGTVRDGDGLTTACGRLDDARRHASCALDRASIADGRTRHDSNCACRRWNGRLLYQGGGGNDGAVAPAVGRNTGSFPDTGLQRGFAVVTTDAGHQGVTADFGVDPVARVDHAYAAHERTYTMPWPSSRVPTTAPASVRRRAPDARALAHRYPTSAAPITIFARHRLWSGATSQRPRSPRRG